MLKNKTWYTHIHAHKHMQKQNSLTSSHLPPQMLTRTRTRLGWSQESGTQARSPMRVALEPPPMASQSLHYQEEARRSQRRVLKLGTLILDVDILTSEPVSTFNTLWLMTVVSDNLHNAKVPSSITYPSNLQINHCIMWLYNGSTVHFPSWFAYFLYISHYHRYHTNQLVQQKVSIRCLQQQSAGTRSGSSGLLRFAGLCRGHLDSAAVNGLRAFRRDCGCSGSCNNPDTGVYQGHIPPPLPALGKQTRKAL